MIGDDVVDTLRGGSGNDVILGRYDTDTLSGGTGSDRFLYRDVEELFRNVGTGRERITDFEVGTDLIDLSQIDWNGTGADNAFTFRGAAASMARGRWRFRQAGGATFVDISWQAAAVAESIRLDGPAGTDGGGFRALGPGQPDGRARTDRSRCRPALSARNTGRPHPYRGPTGARRRTGPRRRPDAEQVQHRYPAPGQMRRHERPAMGDDHAETGPRQPDQHEDRHPCRHRQGQCPQRQASGRDNQVSRSDQRLRRASQRSAGP